MIRQNESTTKRCCVCGSLFSSHYQGKPYCNKHYQSMHLYGQPFGHKRERTNKYEIEGDILTITTSKGERILADAEYVEKLSKHSWCISKTGYPVANVNGKTTKLHRYLLDLTDDEKVVDHINHNPLDNRCCNLRVCSRAQNLKNVGPKNGNKELGIRLTPSGRYNVRIVSDHKEHHVGNYLTLEEARLARIEAERMYHGEFGYHDSMEAATV